MVVRGWELRKAKKCQPMRLKTIFGRMFQTVSLFPVKFRLKLCVLSLYAGEKNRKGIIIPNVKAKKEIKKMKITGAKKAVTEYRKIIKRGNYPIMYVDREDGFVWTDEHVSKGSYTNYRSDAITTVNCEITVKAVTETALQLCNEYQKIDAEATNDNVSAT